MKSLFCEPEVIVTIFAVEDVLAVSGGGGGWAPDSDDSEFGS